MNKYKIVVGVITVLLSEITLFSSEIDNIGNQLVYFQFQDAEGVKYGVRENSILFQKAPFLINLSTHQRINQERDGAEGNPFLLTGIDHDNLNRLNVILNGDLDINEISDEKLVDIAILVDYLQLNSSESDELKKFVDQLKGRLQKEVRDVDLFDTQDIEGLKRIAQIFGDEIQDEINKAIPPVYFRTGKYLYGLRKDHLLLQTDFFDKIKRRSETGSIEDPGNIDMNYFEELVRKIQDLDYDLFESADFEANIDLYSHLLSMTDRFLLLGDERFNQFIFDFAIVLKNNQDNLKLLDEQMYEFALQIIGYEELKNDYMIQIGGVKTGENLRFENDFQMFAKMLNGKTITLNSRDLMPPIYLIDEQEYINSGGVKDWVRKACMKENFLQKDQNFKLIAGGKNITEDCKFSIETFNEWKKKEIGYFYVLFL